MVTFETVDDYVVAGIAWAAAGATFQLGFLGAALFATIGVLVRYRVRNIARPL